MAIVIPQECHPTKLNLDTRVHFALDKNQVRQSVYLRYNIRSQIDQLSLKQSQTRLNVIPRLVDVLHYIYIL